MALKVASHLPGPWEHKYISNGYLAVEHLGCSSSASQLSEGANVQGVELFMVAAGSTPFRTLSAPGHLHILSVPRLPHSTAP